MLATDWVTISALATAGGTLVLALATFASVRSANRAARVAERSLLLGLRPLLLPSKLDDPPQKVGFADGSLNYTGIEPKAYRLTSTHPVAAYQFNPLDNVGVFTFSDEEGTPSFELAGRVPPAVKEARRRRLLARQKRISARRSRRLVGRRAEVLVEGAHPESDLLLRGRLSTQAPDIDGSVIINDGSAAAGSFVTCEITEAHPYDLVARPRGQVML